MRHIQPSWVRGLRRPGTAIHVLNSHSPDPGGTVPDLRIITSICTASLFPPRGQLHTGFTRHACFPMAQALLSLGVTMGTHSSRGAVTAAGR